ncbi:MAG TPA: GNAT family N-acetyltransferase [Rhodothermales bacterium]|nr:GNAT family N-acetyltransferase [Rhodothermales bacterium]HRR10019.1 GNAT family N-acetyltransferase [Rhodothermales bacterium]
MIPPPYSIRLSDMQSLPIIERLNEAIFGDRYIIARMDREDLTVLLAYFEGLPVGFKIGYMGNEKVFYSAKGGVLPTYRRNGLARAMLHQMMDIAQARGYRAFVFDTFPNKHPGMTILALSEGFSVINAQHNRTFNDYNLRFQKML